eukprot:2591024-Ditylum_brightwellii.AAC.1
MAQEEQDKQCVEAKKMQKEAIKEVEKKQHAALKEAETKQTDVLIAFKLQTEEATHNIISENFDKLLQQSEEIKAKSKEIEEWHEAFHAEQKKHFREQEKKISKKIDAKLSDLSFVVDAKLNAHQEENNKNN